MALARDFRELDVYKKAYACAQKVCELTRGFPAHERYALSHGLCDESGHEVLRADYHHVMAQLTLMMRDHHKWCPGK